MKRSLWCVCLLGALCCQSLLAAERAPIEVIHDGYNTIPAKPYYRQIEIKQAKMSEAMDEARKQLAMLEKPPSQPVSLATYFPMRTSELHVGEPRQKIIPQLPIPMFIIGMDARSLNWLEANFDELKAIGARGVVVQAESYEKYEHLQKRAIAKGVLITATPGDPIAEVYEIQTYPMLLKGQ